MMSKAYVIFNIISAASTLFLSLTLLKAYCSDMFVLYFLITTPSPTLSGLLFLATLLAFTTPLVYIVGLQRTPTHSRKQVTLTRHSATIYNSKSTYLSSLRETSCGVLQFLYSNPQASFSFRSSSRKRLQRVTNLTYYKTPTSKMKYTAEFFKRITWVKVRIMYFANNWIYTTNHKRIAINYFFFVLFSGVCGMALATIIRLEMAYPGVGILAGDSLQYLAVVTAHAVIMVFFMIMPLLFGAYSNFLLPTQLGVHDVAFPRLNSAAFWFLPAGLIMLAQLVCLDRRYQRMNCFNMRELQALLKEKYYPDLITSYEQKLAIFHNGILRYKSNDLSFVDPRSALFLTHGLNSSVFFKIQNFSTADILRTGCVPENFNNLNYYSATIFLTYSSVWNLFADAPLVSAVVQVWSDVRAGALTRGFVPAYEYALGLGESCFAHLRWQLVILFLDLTQDKSRRSDLWIEEFYNFNDGSYNMFREMDVSFCSYVFDAVSAGLTGSLASQLRTLSNLCTIIDPTPLLLPLRAIVNRNYQVLVYNNLLFTPETGVTVQKKEDATYKSSESATSSRALRFTNPIFKYDYKLGNYLTKEMILSFPNLVVSQIQVTGGIRKPTWFYSIQFIELFSENVQNYLNTFLPSTDEASCFNSELAHPGAMGGFYNLFYDLGAASDFVNTHWILNNSLNQKFYRIFLTSSMQQRVYANWRQLKFAREAWRCKLLTARHQKTLYHRYVNEDGVFWAVERNAKDVLPGWAMITPFSARTRFTAIGKVDIGLMGVFLVLNSSIVSSANFLVTYRYLSTLNNRKRRDARSFFTEGIIVASWMMIAANPMLAIAILMLLSDRHWQTSFFDYSGGGDTVLFQHMFWFFGHPEVYVIMIPAFGFNNTILSFYLRKRVSARASLLYSMYTIAFLGFFVWGHHMYMVGLAHTTRMLFSTLTVMISVPAATKLMHWCVTLVNSSIQAELPLFFAFIFIFFFVSGGISGMAVAHTGMDILFHDTYYVIGHFHIMLAGSAMFASFGAFYFYFPAIFGVKFSRIYGYIHFVYYLLGQLMTVIPMMWLGYSGMPRRILDYPAALGGWHAVVSAGHLLSVAGMLAFFIMIFDSLRRGRAATRNSFGITRFNTRLNFYLYETSKTLFIQRKCWYVSRTGALLYTTGSPQALTNCELLELNLYTYLLVK